LAEDVAYNGNFHDDVRDQLLKDLIAAGNKCEKEVNLDFNGVEMRADIICRDSAGELGGFEVKTGANPSYTPQQAVVYPHVLTGAGVISNDSKNPDVWLLTGRDFAGLRYHIGIRGPSGRRSEVDIVEVPHGSRSAVILRDKGA